MPFSLVFDSLNKPNSLINILQTVSSAFILSWQSSISEWISWKKVFFCNFLNFFETFFVNFFVNFQKFYKKILYDKRFPHLCVIRVAMIPERINLRLERFQGAFQAAESFEIATQRFELGGGGLDAAEGFLDERQQLWDLFFGFCTTRDRSGLFVVVVEIQWDLS